MKLLHFSASQIAVVFMLLLVACSSKDDNYSLRVTLKDSTSLTPVSGATVVLYNEDNKTFTLDHIRTSNSDGVVDFGMTPNSNATISVMNYINQVSTLQKIDTYVDVPAGDIKLYMTTTNSFLRTTCSGPSIAVNVAGVDITDGSVSLQPIPRWVGINSQTSVNQNIHICPNDIQTDGKISLLAYATVEPPGRAISITKYGKILDEQTSSGATYEITLDHTPTPVLWSTSSLAQLNSISFMGVRKGASYYEGTLISGLVPLGASGSALLPLDFPFDYHIVTASAITGDRQSLTVQTMVDNIEGGVVLATDVDLRIIDAGYDASAHHLNWNISGNHGYDAQLVSIGASDLTQNTSLTWIIHMPTQSRELTLPDLPIESKIGISNIISYIGIYAMDYSKIDGYENYWQATQALLGNRLDERKESLGTQTSITYILLSSTSNSASARLSESAPHQSVMLSEDGMTLTE